jgi:hypothetical protein
MFLVHCVCTVGVGVGVGVEVTQEQEWLRRGTVRCVVVWEIATALTTAAPVLQGRQARLLYCTLYLLLRDGMY